jgi:hypothetical protein
MSPARNYRQLKTGRKVKGVTTHCSTLAKNALIFWGYKQGLSNYERLMSTLAIISNQDKNIKELLVQTIKEFKTTSLYEKRDKAGDAGTLGHTFVENHLRGLPDPDTKGIDPEVAKKSEGCYLTFLDWEKSNKIKVIGSEVELTSEEYPFGGTIDHVIQSAMTPVDMVEILDIKTGKDIYLEAKIQVRAYKSLWEEHDERKVSGFHILRLGENGEFTHKYFPNLDDGYWEIFGDLMDINERLEKLGEKL